MTPFMLPLDRLLLKEPVPAGMDWSVIGLWCAHLRKTNEPYPPLVVKPGGHDEHGRVVWRLQDGRHRYFAAVIAGRNALLAVIEDEQG